ncbi:MAG: hypothetical protein AB1760_03475 [Pseudomonadota bacterium]|nr:hypothetical protein [Caulobacteraceae bacterium]
MSAPIDPVRQIARLRRLRRRTDGASGGAEQDTANLPVPVNVAPAATPAPDAASSGPAVFSAHIMAQGEQRRGLKAGASTLDAARSAYNQTEYSGGADRRARKGGLTRTDI